MSTCFDKDGLVGMEITERSLEIAKSLIGMRFVLSQVKEVKKGERGPNSAGWCLADDAAQELLTDLLVLSAGYTREA